MNENSTQDVDAFLEHFGIKGMHWGEHSRYFKKGQRGDFRSRSGKQKLALIGGGAAGFFVGARVATFIINVSGGKTLGVIAGAGVQAATTVAGVRITRAFLDRHGSKKVRNL